MPFPQQLAIPTPAATFRLAFLLVTVALLPGLVFFFGASSLAAGTTIAALAIIIADLTGMLGQISTTRLGTAAILAVLGTALGLHLFVGLALTGQGDATRGVLSFVILILFFNAALIIADRLPSISSLAINRTAFFLLAVFGVAALFSAVGIQPPSPRGNLAKSVFPFSEPSHYAFSVAPIVIYTCSRVPSIWRILIIFFFFTVSYILQSLSLIIVVLLACALTLPLIWLLPVVFSGIFVMTILDIQYFTDRLDFSTHSTNVSSLIYIQGIELAESSFQSTFGWGLGFQQLGTGDIHSLTANAIAAILREDANIYDGGFTAAKLVAEFGVFGIAALVLYSVISVIMAFKVRRFAIQRNVPAATAFLASAMLGFLIEMFVRGAGYFTGTSMIALASLIYYFKIRRLY